MNKELSEKWIKASVTGTIWAASEIVLGSFLHNLNIPFSGNILTAIGIVILISIGHIWNDRGIFWRAGLICAIMKTMSPSAVIFGPMIAIFSESLLLEASVSLIGRNIAGFCTGAMLAMSWNLFQKIGSFIVYYGSDIIQVYAGLLKMAQKQLNIETEIVWLPLVLLLILYALFGLASAIIGIKVGRKMLRQPFEGSVKRENQAFTRKTVPDNFSYSTSWLFLNIILIIFSFFLLNHTEWYVWSSVIAGIVVIWSLRYKRAMRRLSKPGFWVFFVVITIITAFVFTKTVNNENFWRTGFLTGIQMNFRAMIIITGFAVLGTELYNPVVRNFFINTSFRNLPLSVELSVESLPSFIATIPDFKSLVKDPVSIFHQVLSQASNRFAEIRDSNRRIFIISGAKGEGKTRFTSELADILKKNKIRVAGILSERVTSGAETTGYDIIDIATGKRTAFLRSGSGENHDIGKYTIVSEGLSEGKRILHSCIQGIRKVVIIDEVGRLELNDGGWAAEIQELLKHSGNHLAMVVREDFIEMLRTKWGFENPVIMSISTTRPTEAAESIIKNISSDTASAHGFINS
jgi:nucleoside-triphosphatase THEP1